MFRYNLKLALRSLRRNVVITALMVAAIGVGIGASMTVYTVLRAMSGNPIPQKSDRLFTPQIDVWGPPSQQTGAHGGDYQLPGQLTYRDAMALMQARRAQRQAVMYGVSLDVGPAAARAFRVVYLLPRTISIMLGVVSALLLAVTGFGVVGLTTYWVSQRRRQIGMRRALGARRADILAYFHTENLLIVAVGCMLGIVLGLTINTAMASSMQLTRMSVAYVCMGAVIVLVLCQLAVLWPALRAASIPPAIATRGL